MIVCEHVSIKYVKQFYSLYDICHTFNVGDKVQLVGDMSSGNDFLLRIIAGIDKPSHGKMRIKNYTRKDIGYLPRHPAFFEAKSPIDNLTYPLKIRKLKKNEAKLMVENICHLYEKDYLLTKKVKDCNEAERQTLALLRLIVRKPKIVLLSLSDCTKTDEKILNDLIKMSEIAIVALPSENECIYHNQTLNMFNGSIVK